MNLLSNTQSWGLFQKDKGISLPLKSLHISVQIIHNISRVHYTQTYQNTCNDLLETEFFFPISPDACFDSFEAKFNDTTIKGIVKEKGQAKQQYNEAISAGNIAAYSEINRETGDLMKVLIGNIPPSSEVSVKYSYIEKMETSLSKFWCFRLLSCFTPRYNGDLDEYLKRDIALLASYPTVNQSEAYPWTIEVEVQSPSQIQFIQSPSHQIVTKYGNENHTCTISLDPEHNYKPNKDFVLLYSNGKENEVNYVMTPLENSDYCAMVNLIADFSTLGLEETYESFVKAKQIDVSYEMDKIRGEYIFLIDRSGSMQGERIEMARSSLLLFLKSLPKDSYYNVVSFGENHHFLHLSSQKYSQKTLTNTSKFVEMFSADMGGTEIYTALDKVYNSPPLDGYPRYVFLLTDGDVSNTQKVLDLIQEHSNKIRTFTIGIGNGCSVELIKKGALYGKGKYEFVQNNKDYAKVISLLDASLSPTYSDLSLHADNFDAVVEAVTPIPSSIPFLMNGQQITFFLFIRKDAFEQSKKTELELRLYDSRIQNHRSVKVILDSEEAILNRMLPKLAIHDMIKRLEAQQKLPRQKTNKKPLRPNDEKIIKATTNMSEVPEIEKPSNEQQAESVNEGRRLWNDNGEITEALLELSVKYGVLCKETAFFCEIAQNNDEVKSLRPVKVIVPTVASHDYGYEDKIDSVLKSIKGNAPGTQVSLLSSLSLKSFHLDKNSVPINLFDIAEGNNAPATQTCLLSSLSLKSFHLDKTSDPINLFDVAEKSLLATTTNYNTADTTENYSSYAKKEEECKEEVERENDGYFEESAIALEKEENKVISSSVPSTAYLEIIMKQTFEGYWEPIDKAIQTSVLAGGNLTQVPQELEISDTQAENEKVWLTILVLLWLEVVFQKEKQAWRLIHQKGCDWLKSQGVSYEKVKDIGKSAIKV